MNDDGHGGRVFDGVMSHVAGAGKAFANHRFGMPGRTATQHEDRLYPENWFPFGNTVATDPFSRRTGAILKGHATDPLVIETNSSTEYWQKGASLVHTDPTGRHDADLPPNVRVYMIAGTQHGGRPGFDPSPGPCVNPRATRTTPPRHCAHGPSRWKSGSQGGGARRRAVSRGSPTAPRSTPRASGCRRCRASPSHPAPTRSSRRSIGST